MRFLIVTGLSGAGKSCVLKHLEDSGYLCMDNLPPLLLSQAFALCEAVQPDRRVALGVDSRGGALFDPQAVLHAVQEGRDRHGIDILFLEADTQTLIDRYEETRRDHPLAHTAATLEQAILHEREMLEPLRERADFVLSTSALTVRALKDRVDELLERGASGSGMRTDILSFGYKRGIPHESDLVFDVRFLPNPYYIPAIRAYTGLEAPVRDYLLSRSETQTFLTHLYGMLDFLLPLYRREGKRRLTIAIGCTGGAHRSVAVAQALFAHLQSSGQCVRIVHRDIDVEQASWPFRRDRT